MLETDWEQNEAGTVFRMSVATVTASLAAKISLHNNNNNVHLSCARQRPERSRDTY